MTGDDLIVAAPWLVFAAGLTVIAWRLAAGRRHRRRRAAERARGPATPPRPERPVSRRTRPGPVRGRR